MDILKKQSRYIFMKNAELRTAIVLSVLSLGVVPSFAQDVAKPPEGAASSSVQTAQTSDLSLVGTLEGKRTWLTATGAQRNGGIKIERVKIENGKGTGILTGYAASGGSGPCSHVDAVPAQLTLDSSNVLTIVADSGTCGIWEYTLKRISPTHFEGRHRINPTEIVLEFTPGS